MRTSKKTTKHATRTLTLDAELVEGIEMCARLARQTVSDFLTCTAFDILNQLHSDASIRTERTKDRILARTG
jgi:hypothetical protein